MSRLLVSVRSASEAEAARAGGCHLLDAKEPAAGALGSVAPQVLAEIVAVAQGLPVSAALGELPEQGPLAECAGACLVKIGMAGWQGRAWRERLALMKEPRLVLAAYADHERAESPAPEDVLAFAAERGMSAFLIDTWHKDGRGLRAWMSRDRLFAIAERCRAAGLPLALAGSLTPGDIAELAEVRPDWFAVRGAACDGGRNGVVSLERVAELAALVR